LSTIATPPLNTATTQQKFIILCPKTVPRNVPVPEICQN